MRKHIVHELSRNVLCAYYKVPLDTSSSGVRAFYVFISSIELSDLLK